MKQGVKNKQKRLGPTKGSPALQKSKKTVKCEKKKQKAALDLEPVTLRLPARCLTTGVAVHPLI